jgi:hypothetical protein
MTIVSAIILAGIVAVVAGSIAFTVIGYEALIAYGAPPARSAFSDVRAVDDGSLIAYVEHRRRWRWWFKLCDPVACMIEPGWILLAIRSIDSAPVSPGRLGLFLPATPIPPGLKLIMSRHHSVSLI